MSKIGQNNRAQPRSRAARRIAKSSQEKPSRSSNPLGAAAATPRQSSTVSPLQPIEMRGEIIPATSTHSESLPAVVVASQDPAAAVPGLSSSAASYARAFRSERTRTAYDGRWAMFAAWCEAHNTSPLPADPAQVANYLVELADGVIPRDPNDAARGAGQGPNAPRKASTIAAHLAAISFRHRHARRVWTDARGRVDESRPAEAAPDPTKDRVVQMVWAGIKNRLGARPERKAALRPEQVAHLLVAFGEGLAATRDRAMVLLGFFSGLRRSELCGLRVQDVAFQSEGLLIHLGRTKTDQAGVGRDVVVPRCTDEPAFCPVESLRAWLDAAGIAGEGPLFRAVFKHRVRPRPFGEGAFVRRLKRAAKSAGLDSREIAGHSLRAGFVTSALSGGATVFSVMDATGHTSVDMLRRYLREANKWSDPAASKIRIRIPSVR